MQKILNSLYGKLSAMFLVLLLVSGTALLTFLFYTSRDFVAETDQKLNRSLAEDLALRFQPFLKDSLNYGAIEHTFKELMVMNPRVEIYLLDSEGNLLAYFADPEKIKRMSVHIEPINAFLSTSPSLPLYGDDPRSSNRKKPFSATPVLIGGTQPGYLYVILGGEQYDTASSMVRESYIVRSGILALIGIFLCTSLAGLLLFFLLTKRLRTVTGSVQKFAQGDYPQRVLVHSRDEIGQLGIAFNQMADTIISSMEKIRQNDVLRRELIANISHDLRSPLASIQGYLETVLMKESTLSLEQRRRFLNTVYHNVSMLSRLVNELFELSKLDARQVEPQTEPFSLAELAQDLILEFQPQAEEKRIRLHPPNSPNLPFVYADIGMIERALSNLLENALRYTPEGGDVTVKLTPLENSVQVCVQDNGQGISPEDLPFIFDRFYRADKSRAKNASSAGLGLAIAQKILEAHNSQICVQSEINTGTTFTFELPAYKPV